MSGVQPASVPPPAGPFLPTEIKLSHAILIVVILLAIFTRFWRLGEPVRCYFDEVYFPTTGAEILRGDREAWEFYGHENTHPPLSKVLMAGGMGIFGQRDYEGGTNDCWGDEADAHRRTDPNWLYDPFGFRFPGALLGVAAVVFMYLTVRRLFHSEVAALSSAFLLSIDGLVLAQSRIATPDTYVLGFTLGALYFLISSKSFFSWRMALAGVFLGAAAASKWIGAFAIGPMVLYFAWWAYTRWRAAETDQRLREAERVLLAGAAACGLGVVAFGLTFVATDLSSTVLLVGGIPVALGAFIILGGLVAIATDSELRKIPRAQTYVQAAAAFPLFFIAVPFAIYMASYIPMFIAGYGLNHWWDLNRMAYEFHSGLEASHAYQSEFWQWPINYRPVFLYLGGGYRKIYNLGNPIVFWMAIPALVFCAWQGLRLVRVRVEENSRIRLWGSIGQHQAMVLFVVLGYLIFWLSLSTQGRALFLYHYQPALAFGIMALGYAMHWLYYHQNPASRWIAVGFLAMAGATFVYFYPHWTAVDVPRWLDESYYWFRTWR